MEGYGNENPGAFQPTRPLRGATSCANYSYASIYISTHAPLAGRDGRAKWYTIPKSVFQPTRPLRGATMEFNERIRALRISTHAPLAGRDPSPISPVIECSISTHAPLAGRDAIRERDGTMTMNFNPRAPCGARQVFSTDRSCFLRFQPTRPLRGATVEPKTVTASRLAFQPTRPLRGATCDGWKYDKKAGISTHAPLAGRDPTPRDDAPTKEISTHAPLAGRGCRPRWTVRPGSSYFNPRAPCGARPDVRQTAPVGHRFQPTRPLRGATWTAARECWGRIFQPTRPLRGATMCCAHCSASALVFQPTRPLRGATLRQVYR